MAKELARGAEQAIAVKGPTAIKKHAKKAAKHAGKKHATKKHAKKAAKHAGEGGWQDKSEQTRLEPGSIEHELRRAFHHLQRASALISLIEAQSGGDLKVLLRHGIEFYREATEGGKIDAARAAVGLLRAAEHLSMAGLYAARGVHPMRIEEPSTDDVKALVESIGRRMVEVDSGSEYGLRLHALVFELVKRAEGAEHDPHLAWELVNGADGVCFALEAEVI